MWGCMIRKSLQQEFRLVESIHIHKSNRHFTLCTRLSNVIFSTYFNIEQIIMGCTISKIVHKSAPRMSSKSEDFIEGVVCQTSDLKENEPKTFDLDEGKVLLIKQKGNISALGTKCTHYGAPLVNSAVGDGRLRCQWHGACFNITTGDIEDFPGLDSLPCYQVIIEDNNVKVRARKSELEANKRVKPMAQRSKNNQQHIVVIGGGPAGASCVEALRQENFTGQITLVCKENYLPYDRVKVSKAMDFDIDKSQFRDRKFYQGNDIDVLNGVEATSVNTSAKTVTLSNGRSITYDKLFVATGCKPRKLQVQGADLKNVIVLRNYDHAKYTNSQLSKDKDLVVLGGSFVAMEAANYCENKVNKVTVILRGDIPFKPLLGPEIGAAFMKLFQEKGVNFITKNGIKSINGDVNGNVTSVELNDGSILKADLVIMGVGSTYNTDFLKSSGIDIQPDGTIETNEYLQTNIPDVYVGGDIALAPVWCHDNLKFAIGHFPLAHYHGKMAALNMLGRMKAMQAVPFFWTMLYGKGVRYAGHGNYDEIIYSGDIEAYKFVAFYLKNGTVVAASSCGMDPVVSHFAECLAQGKVLTKEDLKEDPLAWVPKKN